MDDTYTADGQLQIPYFVTDGNLIGIQNRNLDYGKPKAIAISSATLLKPNELTAIRMSIDKTHSSLHMYPDQDAPGESLFAQLKECFPQLTHHQLPAGCKDFSDFYVKNVKRKV